MNTFLVWYHVRRALAPLGGLAVFALWRLARLLRFVLTLAFSAVVLCLAVAAVALMLPGVLGVILAVATYFLFNYVVAFWRL
jgi:hypothetical protein